MKSKLWIAGFCVAVIIPLAIAASWVIRIDPWFHYHKPNVTEYFYPLYNQRSQNDGISKKFDYEGLITGTSMTENFKTSEAESVFGCRFVKVPYSGGSYKEINDNLKVALAHNKNVKIIIRSLDMGKFIEDKDTLRIDLGEYPAYLYNENPFDDVRYLFNRDILFSKIYTMAKEKDVDNFQPGITPFDTYSNWMAGFTFGVNTLYPNGVIATHRSVNQVDLTEEEKRTVLGTVKQNITSLAEDNPDVIFYYFFTPYSAVWWQSLINNGTFEKQIQAEKIVIEEILKTKNIKLYSFNNLTGIITDLNNYKDMSHYASWINSLMLRYMSEETCILTKLNYEDYLQKERKFYWDFDYEENFNSQEDYENDYYSAALLNCEINGVRPFYFSEQIISNSELNNAKVVENQHEKNFGIVCWGSLSRAVDSDISVADYIRDNGEFDGAKISIDDIEDYKYLIVYGKKINNHGQPSIYIYNDEGTVVGQLTVAYGDIDGEWHQYIIDVSAISGYVDIVFQGGYIDSTGSAESEYVFSDITLY